MKIIKEDIINEWPNGFEFDSVSFSLEGNTTVKMSAEEFSDFMVKIVKKALRRRESK